MTDYMQRDRLRDLWVQIEQLHLSYLQTDEGSCKLEQRNKLESYIREYLCIVPHDRKFCFRETADVLHRSASTKEDFSGYRAASAWNAIGMYAANLLTKPWRKEYREMKMYSGFYKHEIEANLVGAELMLEAMGYKHTGHTTMVLDGPIDPDRVSNVSRDSLMAAVECQLLKMIWEEVSTRFKCGWLEVLEFRENHVGTPDVAVRGMMYRIYHQQYQEQQQQQQLAAYHHGQAMDNYGTTPRFHQPTSGCVYGQIPPPLPAVPHIGYYNYSPFPMGPTHAYTLPSQPQYGTVMSPQQALPPTMPYPMSTPVHPPYHLSAQVHPVIKSQQELYSSSGHGAHHQYQATVPPPPVQGMPMAIQNGYTAPSQMAAAPTTVQNYSCPVPTGQLIELDAAPPPPSSGSETQQTYSATDSSSSVLIPRPVRQHQAHQAYQAKKVSNDKQHDVYNRNPVPLENHPPRNFEVPRPEIHQQTPLSKAKDDGTGTFGSWDYVFRNLESQGYNKDLGERPDILSPFDSNNTSHKNVAREKHLRQQQTDASDLEHTLMEMRLEEYHRKTMPNSNEPQTMKINEALRKIKMEDEGENSHIHSKKNAASSDVIDGNVSVYDNMSSPPKEISSRPRPLTLNTGTGAIKSNSKVSTKTLPREPRKHMAENKRLPANSHYSSATLDPRQLTDRGNYNSSAAAAHSGAIESLVNEKSSSRRGSFHKTRSSEKSIERKETNGDVQVQKTAPNDGGCAPDSWHCITCTFLNSSSREVCEMCGKSKTKGSELRPLTTGGRQCPKCTLVNEIGVSTCIACESSLKDSPTYI